MTSRFHRRRGFVGALLLLLALGVVDGGFPLRETEPPPRRLSTLARMELTRLAAAHADVEALARQRRTLEPSPGRTDYRVIFHAHAEDSVHTGGTRPEMLAAAKRAGVNAIFLSDHFRPPRDFMDSWRGLHDGVLFVPGSEARGFLLHPQTSVMPQMNAAPSQLLEAVRADGGLAFLSHIEERPDHPMDQLDGLEIYNRHWDAKRDPMTLVSLALRLTDPRGIEALRQALERFPEETLAAQIDYPADYLAKWDAETPRRPLTGVAANDAHHNMVFVVKMIDEGSVRLGTIVDPDEKMQTLSALVRPGIRELTRGHQAGDTLVRLDFDPYDRSFRSVSTHVLARELTEVALRTALREGRAYVAHDWMGDPTGFRFFGRLPSGEALEMGAVRTFDAGALEVTLEAQFPLPCERIRLLRDGVQLARGRGYQLRHRLREPGVYRVEGWLRIDGEERCWVLSNPLYLRPLGDNR